MSTHLSQAALTGFLAYTEHQLEIVPQGEVINCVVRRLSVAMLAFAHRPTVLFLFVFSQLS